MATQVGTRAFDPKKVGTPNQTLYCTNLPDKLRKSDLRSSLYTLFSTYGTVLDVVALNTPKMRGQAHVVFRDVQASTQALRSLEGFEFFGKEMSIAYAKGSSNIIAKLRGTYAVPSASTEPIGVSTDLQKSIFSGPPGTIPTRPAVGVVNTVNGEGQGLKRPREEESDEDDAPMDEDSDVSMEASDEE
ncbi:U1 small nuclear ribonucleoprotein A [Penicillium taxi]|uniref:U1 small nuclear ribonucleoprotein A n=1 Tax=Penicillium taxi TaxID=168475 RepID=UPI002545B4B8|nr:U1 small nuclear ribonucleoprotein A [Penicillium taxi]KAJ5894399.1 U1 small nuclear ribonucleoprotein A [Penicillium taxi]